MNTTITRRVAVKQNGMMLGVIRVTADKAATDSDAETYAITAMMNAINTRAAQVAASGGPAWAAEPATLDQFTARVTRRSN